MLRNLEIVRPDQVWSTDITYIPLRHGILYLVAVLDWELTHIGYPAEDLGYICGNVWRFGRIDKPVGGFGEYEDLLEGYRSVSGSAPSLEELRYWEVYCALNWGLVCLTMIQMYRSGQDRSLERAAVGRREAESRRRRRARRSRPCRRGRSATECRRRRWAR